MTRQIISTPNAPIPAYSYSQGIVTNGLVFTSGFGPIDPDTDEVAGDDVIDQTNLTLKNIAAVLESRGITMASVVKTTVFLQNLQDDFPAFDETYRAWFSEPLPVRTTVGATLNGILVEIDVVAELD